VEIRRRDDVKQLKKRLALVVQEKRTLENNICDAEAALRTSARYESVLTVVATI